MRRTRHIGRSGSGAPVGALVGLLLAVLVVVVIVTWAGTGQAEAETPDAAPIVAKKTRSLEAKKQASAGAADREARRRWQRELDRRIARPVRTEQAVINIYNTWTHEMLVVDALPAGRAGKSKAAPASEVGDPTLRKEGTPERPGEKTLRKEGTPERPGEKTLRKEGTPERPDDATLDHFFRCHYTNQPTDMDGRLFAALVAAARHFGSDRIDIVSGYRSPKYNLILRKKGREVARQSEHTFGHAVDFRLRGVGVQPLHAWARDQRLGGVGLYPQSGFIHMDTGRIRYWTGR